jgi:hypothetical protein
MVVFSMGCAVWGDWVKNDCAEWGFAVVGSLATGPVALKGARFFNRN